jgi:DNA ligase-1
MRYLGVGRALAYDFLIKERDDKKPDEASTSKMIAEMYQRQESVSKTKGPSIDDDFEY